MKKLCATKQMTVANASSSARLLTPSFSLVRFVVYGQTLSSRTARLIKARPAQAVATVAVPPSHSLRLAGWQIGAAAAEPVGVSRTIESGIGRVSES